MRFLDTAFARRSFPQALDKLGPGDEKHLVWFDGFLYLMDDNHYGYSEACWLSRNQIWAPHIRKIA